MKIDFKYYKAGLLVLLLYAGQLAAQRGGRVSIPIKGWYTEAFDSVARGEKGCGAELPAGMRLSASVEQLPDSRARLPASGEGVSSALERLAGSWKYVTVPHNWDAYDGYRRKVHGNRHGTAVYKSSFKLPRVEKGQRYFLFFEGVGSYATVWLNGKQAGAHAGGRTSFTIDITAVVNKRGDNYVVVRADHPAGITDLPWVCGGCSPERGFSEGSQPMGIFRPAHLVVTSDVRVEPFGVHAWNDTTVSASDATIQLNTTIKNYSALPRRVQVINRLITRGGKLAAQAIASAVVAVGKSIDTRQQMLLKGDVRLWSPDDPYLYTIVTLVKEKGKTIDSIGMPYGIRWINWSVNRPGSTNQFFVNGKPVFINGIAEYEHLLGNSHAFTDEQVRARALQMKAVGFNAFRDAHQPHNLRYQTYWDSLGILWWTQLSAHVWYDTPRFRDQFKQLLKEWVIERRSNPSVVLWGLQNESKLPADFARECTELIRSLDPTASQQRLVTTCNGGEGTDWDVPQNWTGTYGGDPSAYDKDVKRQVLIGEYGAWRTLDLHTEGGFVQNGPYSEDRMTLLMEQKIRLAESVKDSSSGHFFWLYTSHDNPGRVQGGEGLRELDRIGPVNYKGLLTPWEEPLDVFHMFRSNYAVAPMVYIVSHTWPQRFAQAGRKDGLIVYSNCDEVELFNDVEHVSLGRKRRGGVGTHFQWDGVDINYNVLYAIGYKEGKPVARDVIVLQHLPKAPHFDKLVSDDPKLLQPAAGFKYLYRVNAGGVDYTDSHGNQWKADTKLQGEGVWGSRSWTDAFAGMPSFFASQRQTYEPIRGTKDWLLFQSFRYGREPLQYEFPVADGEYLVELFFAEPWWGRGGGMDCKGFRLFDIAINNSMVIKDLDIWKEVGYSTSLKKTIKVRVKGGKLVVSFPGVKVGQAVIAAIAIATAAKDMQSAPASPALIGAVTNDEPGYWQLRSWLNVGDSMYADAPTAFTGLPPGLYGATWLRTPRYRQPVGDASFSLPVGGNVLIGWPVGAAKAGWLAGFEDSKQGLGGYMVYRKRFKAGEVNQLGPPGYAEGAFPMYLVMVSEASSIEPAYDLKPVTSYRAAEGALLGAVVKKIAVNGKEQVVYIANDEGTIDTKMQVGVADEYSLTLKYNWAGQESIKADLSILQADGSLMKKETVTLLTTRPGKWNYITTSTGSMINAGLYIIRFHTQGAEGLAVGGVDVQ